MCTQATFVQSNPEDSKAPKFHLPLYCEGAFKPLLRGWFHILGLALSPLFVYVLFREVDNDTEAVSTFLFGLSVAACLGFSGVYHTCSWTRSYEIFMYQLDHIGILALIAGSYTPLAVCTLPSPMYTIAIITIWTIAVTGVLHLLSTGRPSLVFKLILGASIVPFLPVMSTNMTSLEVRLLCVSWLFHIIGLIIFKTMCINPFKEILGYHEVFHICTLGGVYSTFAMTLSALARDNLSMSVPMAA